MIRLEDAWPSNHTLFAVAQVPVVKEQYLHRRVALGLNAVNAIQDVAVPFVPNNTDRNPWLFGDGVRCAVEGIPDVAQLASQQGLVDLDHFPPTGSLWRFSICLERASNR